MDPFFENLHILVVDDEQFIRQLVTRLLRDMGAKEVLTAKHGKEALRTLSANAERIDLLILDIEMPHVNGLEVLEAVRTGRASVDPGLPVVMLTGRTEEKIVKASILLGVHGFIAKPMSADGLRKHVKSALHSAPVDFKKVGM